MELEVRQNPGIKFERAVKFHNAARLDRALELIGDGRGLAFIAWRHALNSLRDDKRAAAWQDLIREVKIDPYEEGGFIGVRFELENPPDGLIPHLEAPVLRDGDRACEHHEYAPFIDMLESLVWHMHVTNIVDEWFERYIDHSDLPEGQISYLRSLKNQSQNYLIPRSENHQAVL